MDLLLQTRTGEFASLADIEPAARAAIEECLIPTQPPAPTLVKRFSHIFSDPVGYAAGYYSYKWAEVLDADAFEYFQENGIFNSEVAQKFKENILSKGGTEHPMVLYKRFRGQEPKPEALLKRAGLL